MLFFLVVVVALVIHARHRRAKGRTVPLLYKYPAQVVGGIVTFPCGCRYPWAEPSKPPFICAAHQALIAAEVRA